MIPTLPQISLNYNRRIKLSNDSEALSSDTGMFLFQEFDEKLDFSQTFYKHLHLYDTKSHWIHSNENLLNQKIYQMIAGYAEDDAGPCFHSNP